MTPKQLKNISTIDLIKKFKEKGRCFYSQNISKSISIELEKRLGKDILSNLFISKSHLDLGEGDYEFNQECDKLISLI